MKNFEIRQYNINLRIDGLKAPKGERSKRAVVTIKRFIEKNTRAKSEEILIGEELNLELWSKGIKNPPKKVSVFVQKLKSGKLFVNLQGKPLRVEKEKKEEKKEDSKDKKNLEDLTKDSADSDEKKTDKKLEAKKEQPAKPSKAKSN